MIVKKLTQNNLYLLVLKKGDDIVNSLLSYCKEAKINSASVSAIGAVSEAELGFYDLPNKKYINRIITEPMEIASLSGNIVKKDNNNIAHIHAMFSNKNMFSCGGHLIEAKVAATCEIYLTTFNEVIFREHSHSIGLNLISD